VLKIVSPEIIHKSDAGGVKLGLKNATQVGKAYAEIMAAAKRANPKATIYGVSVQKMAKPGVEVIMGMSKDAQFGPVLMFGLGGVFVEVLKDVAFRIVPLARRDASQMIREIKGYPLLEGYRGQEPANITVLEDMLLKLSNFIDKTPKIKEMEVYYNNREIFDSPPFLYQKSAGCLIGFNWNSLFDFYATIIFEEIFKGFSIFVRNSLYFLGGLFKYINFFPIYMV
jgi:acyl-CoA synthetase (NDP forming)